MNLNKLYAEYQLMDKNNPFTTQSFFDKLPRSAKKFEEIIHNLIIESIADEDEIKLRFALNIAYRDGIDKSYTELILKLLNMTWHNEHEDLIDTIHLSNLNNDLFTDSLYKIAIEPNYYRKYDDELESTLRKCIHALKMINSDKSNFYIKELKNTKNSNIDSALSMYDS